MKRLLFLIILFAFLSGFLFAGTSSSLAGIVVFERIPVLFITLFVILLVLCVYFAFLYFFKTSKHSEPVKSRCDLLHLISLVDEALQQTKYDEQINKNITEILKNIGKQISADRICIWQLQKDSIQNCLLSVFWESAENAQNKFRAGSVFSLEEILPDSLEKLVKGNPYILTPSSESSGRLKYKMAANHTVSKCILPLVDAFELCGFIEIDTFKVPLSFSQEELMRLSVPFKLIFSKLRQSELRTSLGTARTQAVAGTDAKSNFLANMTHELRSPLNVIMGLSDLILGTGNLPSEILNYAQNINSSSRNLFNVVSDILDFSNLESGNLEITPVPYDFADLVNDIITSSRLKLSETYLSFFIYVDPTLPAQLIGDCARIKQVFLNLISNSLKYTKEGSITVRINGTVDSEILELEFEIQDTGIGIKEEEQEKIFKMFQRLDNDMNVAGTGIGLALSRKLCELMDGSLDFHSEYGNGTTFTAKVKQRIRNEYPLVELEKIKKKDVLIFEPRRRYSSFLLKQFELLGVNARLTASALDFSSGLQEDYDYDYIFVSAMYFSRVRTLLERSGSNTPVVVIATNNYNYPNEQNVYVLQSPLSCITLAQFLSEESPLRQHTNSLPLKDVYAPKATVLLVDDNAVSLQIASGLLKLHGISTDTVTSGFDALSLLQEKTYDLIFMDYLMPGMDGMETAKEIRKMSNKNSKTPIIALSANALSGIKEKFLAEGMNDYLTKPVEKNELNDILARWLPTGKIVPRVQKPVQSDNVQDIQFVIPNVNTVSGVKYAGNSITAYIDVLKTYVVDSRQKMQLLSDAYARKDWRDYAVNIHAIKSASKAIGAEKLSVIAARLEKAASEENAAFIAENSENCLDMIKETAGDIEVCLNSIKTDENTIVPTQDGNVELLYQKITAIKNAADNYNILFVKDAAEELETYKWEKKITDALSLIRSAAEYFDYESIVKNSQMLIKYLTEQNNANLGSK
ncbi:MAG: response regulator [Spirochaetaceae bacterium]|nr:response regulator [Spirochaetaceae bacterium]